MKKKTIGRLSLKKTVISQLSKSDSVQLNGGGSFKECVSFSCGPLECPIKEPSATRLGCQTDACPTNGCESERFEFNGHVIYAACPIVSI